ncbi:MAG: secretin N-terminal domain-containing protein [Bacteroidota bacterium]
MIQPVAIPRRRPWRLLPAVVLLAGCAGDLAYRDGLELLDQGNTEEGLAQLERASREAPRNREYRIHYLNAQAQFVARRLEEARLAMEVGNLDSAEALYRRVLNIDRDNAQGQAGLAAVEQARRHAGLVADAGALLAANDLDGAQQTLGKVLRENPRQPAALAMQRQIDELLRRNEEMSPSLRQAFRKTISLEFRDTALKQVLEALSLHAGLNFVLDKDVPPTLAVTVFLRRVTVEDALDVMLSTNQLRRRVLNDTTLLIYPDTAAKQSEHQELVVRNFFLANADAKQVMSMLKTVLKAKNVFADDKLNLLIMRDTPEMIRLAERMVSIQDVGEPEVMLELEVLEIQRSRLLNLGIQWPAQLVLAPLPSNGTNVTLSDLLHLGDSRIGAALSNTTINLQHDSNDTNLLANPRLRTHNREKALIRIGDRVPVITTTATSTGFLSENVQYVDVGLKLEVEPTIFPNDEVSIKLNLEVSSVSKEVVSKSGSISYQISGRNAATVLRLKDGETQILGGLINDQDIAAANRFPGLGDLPVLGRLFSNHNDSRNKTELVLAITPRLVRSLAPPVQVPAEFSSGTENDPRLNPLAIKKAIAATPPAAAPAPAAALPGPAQPATGPQLRWNGPTAVKAGSTFKLQFKLSTGQAINSLPLQLTYDPAVFELISALPGSFMAQGNAFVETSQLVGAEPGTLLMTQTRSTMPGAVGEGSVLEAEFRARQAAPVTAIRLSPVAGSATAALPAPASVSLTVMP